jgi:hypothetical protein
MSAAAPYDARNKTDYEDMSSRIANALVVLENSPELDATEENLARLAECSRGTLRNRGYPLARLKIIKEERRKAKEKESGEVTPAPRDPVEVHLEDKLRLLEDLQKSRTEAATWFDKYKESESEKKKQRRVIDMHVAEKKSLEERVMQLTQKVKELEEKLSAKGAEHVVVPFRRPPKKQGRRDMGGKRGKND